MTEPSAPQPQLPAPARKPLTPRRLRRKVWRGFLITLLAFLGVLLVLTRTGVTRRLVLPQLSRASGLDIDASRVTIAADLSIIMRGVVVRAPGLADEPGRVLTVDRLVARLDWAKLPGAGAIKEIELERPLLRVSQSDQTGRVNLAALPIFDLGGGATLPRIPTVVLRDGVLELGEHDLPPDGGEASTGYHLLATLPFSGVLAPQPGQVEGRSLFALTRGAGQAGLDVTGMIDQSGVTFSFGNLTLSDWPIEAIPARVRALWTQLDLDGRIVPSRVAILPGGRLRVDGALEGVEVTLPFLRGREADGEPPRLTAVAGSFVVTENSISADLSGAVDRLRQRVVFDLWGFDPRRSPFAARLTTEPMRLERDLALLRHVPATVDRYLDLFGRPEADVEATVWYARSVPGDDARVRLTDSLTRPAGLAVDPADPDADRLFGELLVRNGTASYRGFPYTFSDMSGRFAFTTEMLWIDGLRGVASTGAVLTGAGRIGPLGPTAAVDLDLAVAGIPIDEHLTAAMSDQRRALVAALFSEQAREDLRRDGLLPTDEQQRSARQRLAAIESERQAWAASGIGDAENQRLDAEQADLREVLAFELGGLADARILINRRLGDESVWTRDISVTMPRVGLLSAHFPIPIIAEDARLKIRDGLTEFAVQRGRALRGGSVDINARLETADVDASQSLPSITVEARAVPIDETLIRAIAGPDMQDDADGPLRLAGLLRRLRLAGEVDSTARLFPADGRLAYDIASTLRAVTARPPGAPVSLTDFAGSVHVQPGAVELDLAGILRADDPGSAMSPARLRAAMSLPPGASWTDKQGRPAPAIDATVELPGADLAVPVEHLVALFDRAAGERLTGLRETHRPEGLLDLAASIRGTLSADFINDADLSVRATNVRRVAVDADGLRLEGRDGQGSIVYRPGPAASAAFDGFSIDLSADGAPSGRLAISDTLPLGASADRTPWRFTLDAGRFESPLTRRMVERAAPSFAGWAAGYDPRGVFNLDASRRPGGGFVGRLSPRSITLATPRGDADFLETSGAVVFEGGGGVIESVRATGPGRSVELEGRWSAAGADTDVSLVLSAHAGALNDPAVGLAPPVILSLVDALGAASPSGVDLETLSINLRTGSGGVGSMDTSGRVRLANASLNVGTPVTELDGTLDFTSSRPAPDAPTEFEVVLDADRWRLFGLRMTAGRATILAGREPGSVLVPEISATAHGGRFTGAARLAARPEGPPAFRADFQLAEVRLAPLLADLTPAAAPPGQTPSPEPPAIPGDPDDGALLWDQSTDRSRGLVNASFSLAGVVGEEDQRRGRGRIIASGGPVLLLPLLTPLLEVSNLRLPVGDELGLALASLYVDGDLVVFEDIAVFSDQIELTGYGEMAWPVGELDLRFRSRGVSRIPVLSGFVETVRDEILGTRLTGTLTDPRVSTESFAATRRIVGAIFSGSDDAHQRHLREISRRGAQARERIREAAGVLDRIGAGQVAPAPRDDSPTRAAPDNREAPRAREVKDHP